MKVEEADLLHTFLPLQSFLPEPVSFPEAPQVDGLSVGRVLPRHINLPGGPNVGRGRLTASLTRANKDSFGPSSKKKKKLNLMFKDKDKHTDTHTGICKEAQLITSLTGGGTSDCTVLCQSTEQIKAMGLPYILKEVKGDSHYHQMEDPSSIHAFQPLPHLTERRLSVWRVRKTGISMLLSPVVAADLQC